MKYEKMQLKLDAIDREEGMTAPDIMAWIRDEVKHAYGENAELISIASEIGVPSDNEMIVNVNVAIPKEGEDSCTTQC